MPTDIATLGIAVDSQAVKQADGDLAKLAKTGANAEASTKKLTSATAGMNGEMRKCSSATAEFADRVARLVASVDPLHAAQGRVNAEMAEAEDLYARGAISAGEYAQAQSVLQARSEILATQHERHNGLLRTGAASAKLAGYEMLNLGRQFSDVGVQLAMGMNPLMILVQQGPQIADVLTVAGQRGVTAGAAFRQMGVALWTALAPILPIIVAVGAGVAVIAGGFAIFAREANRDLGDVSKSLNLTEAQMKRLKDAGVDTSITMGDAFKGFFATVSDRISDAFGPQIEWVQEKFSELYELVRNGAVWSIKAVVGVFFGGFAAIKATWGMLPAAFADIAVTAANGVITIVESMVNKVIAKLNSITSMVNSAANAVGMASPFGDIATVNVGRIGNPNAGAASRAASTGATAFRQGYAEGGAAVDAFGRDWTRNAASSRDKRVLDAAGDADGSNGAGKGRNGATDQAAKQSADYLKALREETAEIGKNRIETKMLAVERAALAAPTGKLASDIRAAGDAWKAATNAQANSELKRELGDTADALAFENRLLGMNARERAIASAQREIDLKLRGLERQGIDTATNAIKAETDAILANAAAKGQRELNVDNARAYTDALREMNDALREGVSGFGQLFGTAGAGFEVLINTMTDYADRRAELQQQIAEADERTAEGQRQRQTASGELARAEISYYGDMIGAAKHFFKEKSAGYKVLEAVEKAYRAYQMASLVLEAVGVAKSIALDGAKTASSVANSGLRAAADGVAAIAKAIASLPFPLNIVAGAATAAALVAFGVKVFGGGGKGGAAEAMESNVKQPTYSGPVDDYGMPTSSYSVLKPGATVANDNGFASAPGLVGDRSASSNVSIGPATYNINIEGNADADTVRQLREALEQTEDRAVERSREAVMADLSASSVRQRIGGSS